MKVGILIASRAFHDFLVHSLWIIFADFGREIVALKKQALRTLSYLLDDILKTFRESVQTRHSQQVKNFCCLPALGILVLISDYGR